MGGTFSKSEEFLEKQMKRRIKMANKQKLSNNKKLIYKQTPQVHFRTKWKNKWSNVKYLTLKDYYKERNDFLMTYKNPAERAEIERKTHFEVFFPTKEMLENE